MHRLSASVCICFAACTSLAACGSGSDDDAASPTSGSAGAAAGTGGSHSHAAGGTHATSGTGGATAAGGTSGRGASGGTNSGGTSGRNASGGTSGSDASGGASGSDASGGASGSDASGGASGSDASGGTSGTATQGGAHYFGDAHSGNCWLGPVDSTETEWHNACAPSVKYPAGIRTLYGNYIMGLANEVVLQGLKASGGDLCDACVELSANGKTLLARAVTYGEETGPNDIDVSPEIDQALGGDSGRSVSWRFTSCATTAPVQYTFDGRQWTNTWFFRVWVRNAKIPFTKLEYKLGSGGWSAAERQTDGAFQASDQDFSQGFSVRVTGIDGQTLADDLPGLNTFDPDVGVSSHGNFE